MARSEDPAHDRSDRSVNSPRDPFARRRAGALILTVVGAGVIAFAIRWSRSAPVESYLALWGFVEANSETIGNLANLAGLLTFVAGVVVGTLRFFGIGPFHSGRIPVPNDETDEPSTRMAGSDPTDGRRDLLPPPPELVLGRADELRAAKRALDPSLNEPGVQKTVVAVHGWPGVGKSTFVSELCNDGEVLERFPGGVFFIPVGRSSDARILAEEVCAVLEVPAPPGATLQALTGRIANALSQRRILLVFDDVWDEHHVAPLLLAGRGSAALVATRRLDVASRLATAPEGALKIGLLSEADSLDLLRSRAPAVAAEHQEACRELARALDGLPLALRVAADLLRVEAESGFDVSGLLAELAEAASVLGKDAPPDVGAEGAERTVRALLRKSLERADGDLVRRFACLGVLPPKPLSFGPWAAADVWRDSAEDPPEDGQSEEEKAQFTYFSCSGSSLSRKPSSSPSLKRSKSETSPVTRSGCWSTRS